MIPTDLKLLAVKLGLAPLLITQGRRVRATTPRLAEAAGARQGRQGKGKHKLRLLILGDSAAAGCGIDHQHHALVGRILACFSPQWQVDWELVAQSGRTTARTLDALERLPARPVDAVVTSLGVNDVKNGVSLGRWLDQQQTLIQLLTHKFQVRHILITAVPPMEKFPALPGILGWYLGHCAAAFNRALEARIRSIPHCRFIAPELPLDPALMAADGFHPGKGVHILWGKQIHASLMEMMAGA